MNLANSRVCKSNHLYSWPQLNLLQILQESPYLTTCCWSEVLAPVSGSIDMRASSSSSSDAPPLMAAAGTLLHGPLSLRSSLCTFNTVNQCSLADINQKELLTNKLTMQYNSVRICKIVLALRPVLSQA